MNWNRVQYESGIYSARCANDLLKCLSHEGLIALPEGYTLCAPSLLYKEFSKKLVSIFKGKSQFVVLLNSCIQTVLRNFIEFCVYTFLLLDESDINFALVEFSLFGKMLSRVSEIFYSQVNIQHKNTLFNMLFTCISHFPQNLQKSPCSFFFYECTVLFAILLFRRVSICLLYIYLQKDLSDEMSRQSAMIYEPEAK